MKLNHIIGLFLCLGLIGCASTLKVVSKPEKTLNGDLSLKLNVASEKNIKIGSRINAYTESCVSVGHGKNKSRSCSIRPAGNGRVVEISNDHIADVIFQNGTKLPSETLYEAAVENTSVK